jgi:hypothetical protein
MNSPKAQSMLLLRHRWGLHDCDWLSPPLWSRSRKLHVPCSWCGSCVACSVQAVYVACCLAFRKNTVLHRRVRAFGPGALGDGKRTAPCSQVAKVNVHGYQYEGGRRDLLYTAVHSDGKALWNSEYGEDDASGAKYSGRSQYSLARVSAVPLGRVLPGASVLCEPFGRGPFSTRSTVRPTGVHHECGRQCERASEHGT